MCTHMWATIRKKAPNNMQHPHIDFTTIQDNAVNYAIHSHRSVFIHVLSAFTQNIDMGLCVIVWWARRLCHVQPSTQQNKVCLNSHRVHNVACWVVMPCQCCSLVAWHQFSGRTSSTFARAKFVSRYSRIFVYIGIPSEKQYASWNMHNALTRDFLSKKFPRGLTGLRRSDFLCISVMSVFRMFEECLDHLWKDDQSGSSHHKVNDERAQQRHQSLLAPPKDVAHVPPPSNRRWTEDGRML